MRKFGNPLYHVGVVALYSFVFLSCNKQDAQQSKAADPEKQEHASDWTPTDPELVMGKEIYVVECAMCHDEGEEGAPRLAKQDHWSKREAQPLSLTIDHAINGYIGDRGEMPARGGSDYLSDAEVTAAVKFMLKTPKN